MAKKFNQELLDECMARDGATLVGEYEKLSSTVDIEFTCKCGENNIMAFRKIVESNGAFCEECISKITGRIKFNKKLLDEHIIKDNAKLIGEYTILTNKSAINFYCQCGDKYIKKFSCIVEQGGAFCKKCTQKLAMEKQKKTNIIKYGTEFSSQNNEIKKKGQKNQFGKIWQYMFCSR